MSETVTVRGVDLSVEVSGAGTPLIWGHGLTSSCAEETDLAIIDHPRLSDVARLVRYDARGHGFSQSTKDLAGYGWDELALDQLALASALGIDTYVAGGASMGAATALHAAVAAPDRVLALVVVIPPTAWETRADQAGLYTQMAGVIEDAGVEPVIAARAQMPSPDPFVGRADWKDRVARSMRAGDPVRLGRVFRGAATTDLPPRDSLAQITVPTLILAWSGDAGHPVSTAEALGSLISGSEVHIASTYEQVAGWTDEIHAFLRRL